MSYFDWEHLTKPFKFAPVVQDTIENTKALTIIGAVDYVKTNVVYLNVPSITLVPIWTQTIPPLNPPPTIPLIIAQYNYSVSSPLTFTNVLSSMFDPIGTLDNHIALCVRYRIGTNVVRFLLRKTLGDFASGVSTRSYFTCPDYTNQLILNNFVIEFWQTAFLTTGQTLTTSQLLLETGQIYFPSSYEDTANIIQPIQPCTLTQLETALPETVPTVQDNAGPWLTN